MAWAAPASLVEPPPTIRTRESPSRRPASRKVAASSRRTLPLCTRRARDGSRSSECKPAATSRSSDTVVEGVTFESAVEYRNPPFVRISSLSRSGAEAGGGSCCEICGGGGSKKPKLARMTSAKPTPAARNSSREMTPSPETSQAARREWTMSRMSRMAFLWPRLLKEWTKARSSSPWSRLPEPSSSQKSNHAYLSFVRSGARLSASSSFEADEARKPPSSSSEVVVLSLSALSTAAKRPELSSSSSAYDREPDLSRSKVSHNCSHCVSRTSSRTRNWALSVVSTSSLSILPDASTSNSSNQRFLSSRMFGSGTGRPRSRHMGHSSAPSVARSSRQSRWNTWRQTRFVPLLGETRTPHWRPFNSSKHTAHSECSSAATFSKAAVNADGGGGGGGLVCGEECALRGRGCSGSGTPGNGTAELTCRGGAVGTTVSSSRLGWGESLFMTLRIWAIHWSRTRPDRAARKNSAPGMRIVKE
mmetsp:Transcript_4945/g.15504  ORF Transcript_4945/g.15504 Transcript_4945/m.15504 type:complete len:476 (-) Transcript_4945:282-1709(-)